MLIFCCKFKIFFINSASYRQNSFKFCPFSFFIGEIRGKRRVFGREQQRFRTGTTALSGGNNSAFGTRSGGLRVVRL